MGLTSEGGAGPARDATPEQPSEQPPGRAPGRVAGRAPDRAADPVREGADPVRQGARGGEAAVLAGAALAVDAGNSKTDVAVVAADGRVLGTARSGGFQPPTTGVTPAVDALERTVIRALADATAGPGPRSEPGSGPGPYAPVPLAQLSACLANVDLPREEAELTAAIEARGWARAAHIANDTFAILRAGLPDDGSIRHGVAVVCGAGINCVGRDGRGRTHRFPAVGQLSGDWGGGGGLAAEAVWHAARADDGRGEPTELARALPAYFGLPSMPALIEALHLGDIPRSRKHEIVPLLFEVATAGDPAARALVYRQAEEIVTLATVTLDKLGLLATPTPLFLGGGVAAARHPLLHDRLVRGLADRAPEATPHVVTAPPVLGAALLALDAAGAGPEAYGRLREHYGQR